MNKMRHFSVKKRGWVLKFNAIMVMAALALLPLLTGQCKKKAKEQEIAYALTTAQLVSHVTAGIIASSDEIFVRFVGDVIKENQVGSVLKKEVFSFGPEIQGVASWKDRRTLVFKPNSRLPFHKKYYGELQLPELLPQYKELEPLKFGFQVAGREIESLDGDFELRDADDPERLFYRGTISFTETVGLEGVKKAVSLQMGPAELPLAWKVEEKDRRFSFTSDTVRRPQSTVQLSLKVDRGPVELSQDFEKNFTLGPLKDFKVVEIKKSDQGKRPGLEIKFSDELDLRQDITGLIRLEPAVNFSHQVLGKSIHLAGDFSYGSAYTLKVAGIRSKWGARLQQEVQKQIDFEDQKPRLSFLSGGVFLPSANEQKIGFKTINVKAVEVEVKKVFESNMGQFLQTESVNAGKERNDSFDNYNVNRVGVTVARRELTIGTTKNQWLNHQLDLKKLIKPGEKGLFFIKLSFKKKDMLYTGLTKKRQYYYDREYYSNPNSYGYLYRHGQIYKPVILSDIGLTYKMGARQHLVFATNLLDASPLEGVKVTLRTFQNQVIETKFTNVDGEAIFDDVKEKVFYLEAEKDGQRSIVKPAEMAWNLSSFDTGGAEVAPDETRSFIYTERGVYRPGDEINLCLVARNKDNTFPDNHPVTLEIFNPKNQQVWKQTAKTGTDGFYHFKFQGKQEDLTGNWRAKFLVGSRTYYHVLKIETVVPNRLKVEFEPEKEKLTSADRRLRLNVLANYLFGAPAASLKAEISINLNHRFKQFKNYPGFTFNNEAVSFRSIQTNLFEGTLDEKGSTRIDWQVPVLDKAPSAIQARVIARVFDKGGRVTRNDHFISVDPYKNYVGLEKPRFKYGYTRVGSPITLNGILVDASGNPVSGRSIKYRIYRNARYWWWEYDSESDFRIRYKKDSYTRLVKEGEVISKSQPFEIEFNPESRGEYLLEVQDTAKGGHMAGFFFRAYYWGDAPSSLDSAGTLTLKADREMYRPGDRAVISFPTPEEGTILVTVEKGSQVLDTRVQEVVSASEESKIEIPVTAEMLPNAYVSVSVVQPHSQTRNDRPIRMYGVIPLLVREPATIHHIDIKMVDELSSNQDFSVEIQTGDREPTQLTVAVVDEGLLDLTRFATPDPWAQFYRKQRLAIRTFDLFNLVIGANKGDIFKLFSIGGGLESEDAYRASQLEPEREKRFKPVSMFQGPIRTDKKGKAKVFFKMPNYIGSVRVMVVSARRERYGKAEKTVPVKTDLMVMPTLPRVLGPGDRFTVPVTVFALNEKIRRVDVSIALEGPLRLLGPSRQSLNFGEPGEQDTAFSLQANPAVGQGKITISAVSGKFRAFKETHIGIRAYSPRIYASEVKEIKPGEKLKILIPDRGIAGTNRAVISVMRKAKLNLNRRLYWLIHYPYGCIEQTVSAGFPQLFLKEFIKDAAVDEETIDANINATIDRLKRFKTPGGGFAYWPGGSQVSIWGTNYAGHFMVEAKKRGYNVPSELLSDWSRFQKSRALLTRDNLLERIYRLYILALAGEPQMGPMNLLKENDLVGMSDTEKWLLAAAFRLAGKKETAKDILANTGTQAQKYAEPGSTFGSWLRDTAMLLEIATLFEDWNKADPLYDEIVDELSGNAWYSTQTLAYALLAVGKYMKANAGDFRQDKVVMSGYIKVPGSRKITFETDGLKFAHKIEEGFGQEAEITVDQKTNLERLFVLLEWDGVPLKPDVADESKNLWLNVEWLDENGMNIDPATLKQGTTFWGHFRVGQSDSRRQRRLSELALVQILPSGWEIENIRLTGDDLPGWMRKWNLYRENYLDIRDDRVMWFFDLPGGKTQYDFVVRLTAITAGEFILPLTLFEAMYDNNYKAVKAGMPVKVVK